MEIDGRPVPDHCALGHPIGPGQVTVAWVPCQCRHATGRPLGHLVARCPVCDWVWYAEGHEDGPAVSGPG